MGTLISYIAGADTQSACYGHTKCLLQPNKGVHAAQTGSCFPD